MQQGWNEADESDWEKVRLELFMLIRVNGGKIHSPESLMTLPSIDGNQGDYYEKLKQKILQKRKEIAPLK